MTRPISQVLLFERGVNGTMVYSALPPALSDAVDRCGGIVA